MWKEPCSRLHAGRLPELQVTGIEEEPTASTLPCATCVLVWSLAGRSEVGGAAEADYLDEEVLVMLRPALDGAAVVPRRHMDSLTALHPSDLGRVLAGLRRALSWTQERCSATPLRIEEIHEPPASKDHVCFLLVPTAPEGSTGEP